VTEASQHETPAVADRQQLVLSVADPLRLKTRSAGLFLFLPLLARLGFDELVRAAGYAGSRMVPADAAVLSLLTRKLLDKERCSYIDDFNFEEAMGLFAGLNILPKKSFAADRTTTSPAGARPTPASSCSSPRSTRVGCSVMPTPT
jgi:hypothetical protein